MTAWIQHAACKGLEPSWWFPSPGEVENNRKARAICRDCPVRLECLVDAFENETLRDCGIRGGFGYDDLRKVRTRWLRGDPILEAIDDREGTCVCGKRFAIGRGAKCCGSDCPARRQPKQQKPDPEPLNLPDHIEHGTHAAYNYYGCKCRPCRDRAAEIRRRNKARALERLEQAS